MTRSHASRSPRARIPARSIPAWRENSHAPDSRDGRPSSPPAHALSAQNWPSFRGANAAGIADGKPTAVKWDAPAGQNVAWKTPVDGIAVSSPIVWGNRVFVSTAISSDPRQGIRTGQYGDVEPVTDTSRHTWQLIALDKATGKVVWDKVAYEGVPKTKRHPKSSQASATPVTDGKHVIVSFGSEGLYAYDFDGKLLWKKDLGVLNAGWFFDPDYEWGIGSSPIIYKNMVIVQCDIQRGSFLAAFDTATGKEVWRTAREEIPSWSTPTIFESNGKAELVTQATTVHARLRPDDRQGAVEVLRQLRDRHPDADRRPGFVVITNGYRGVQPIIAVKPGASGDITLKSGDDQERVHRVEHDARRTVHPDAASSTAISSTSSRTTACSPPTRSRPASRSTRSAWAAPADPSAPHRSPRTGRSTCRARTATCSWSRPGRATSCWPRTRSAK